MTLWQKWVAANPIFRYHFLGQTKSLARRPLWQVLLIAACFTILYAWFLAQSYRYGFPDLTLGLECLALWLVAPLITHSLFAAEFEKATWDMLILTRLSAGQIVMGKFLSRLAILLVLALLFIPPLLVGAAREFRAHEDEVVSFLLKSQMVAVGWSVLLVAVTLWLSYRLKRGMVAAAVALAGQIFVLFVLPVFWAFLMSLFKVPGFDDPMYWGWRTESLRHFTWFFNWAWFPILYNPAFALLGLHKASYLPTNTFSLWGVWQGIVYLFLSAVLLLSLMASVAKAARKPLL